MWNTFCVHCDSVMKNQFTITGSMNHESFKIKFDNIAMIVSSLRIETWSGLQPQIDVISRSLRQNGWMNHQTVDCKENADLHLYCKAQVPFWREPDLSMSHFNYCLSPSRFSHLLGKDVWALVWCCVLCSSRSTTLDSQNYLLHWVVCRILL